MEYQGDNFADYVVDLRARAEVPREIIERFNDLSVKPGQIGASIGLTACGGLLLFGVTMDLREPGFLQYYFNYWETYGRGTAFMVGASFILITLLFCAIFPLPFLIGRLFFQRKKRAIGEELARFILETSDFPNMVVLEPWLGESIGRLKKFLPLSVNLK